MTTGAKMRVYEIAREIGLPNKELIAKIRALGLEVNNHMSSLEQDDVLRVKRSLERDRIANTVTKRLSSTVLRRRSRGGKAARPAASEAASLAAGEVESAPPRTVAPPVPQVRRRPQPEVVPEPVKPKPEAAIAKAEPAPAEPPRPPEKPAPAEVAPAAAAPEAAEPEPEATKPERKQAPVVVKGPRIVDLPGHAAAPRPAPAKPQPAPPPSPTGATPQTLADVAGQARSRFEAELERARAQARERDEERDRRAREKKMSEAEQRPEGRPEVGSIINLPTTRIKITERAPSGRNAPGQGQVRGLFARQNMRGGRRPDRRKKVMKKGGKSTQITTPAEHKRVIRMEDTITVADLARNMGIKSSEVLKKLWGMGMMGTTINASIDHDTAQLLSSEFGYEVQNVAFKEAAVFDHKPDTDEDLESRSPVITVMGHVDHGKTSLLDQIRKSRITAGEAGGITQHIGAYRVPAGEGHGDLVFIDTPGHAAFTEMRARGAQITDIVVLVVAADDGAMPQTIEALNHAKDAKVNVVVAVNKIDLPNAQPERIRQQLADHGLIPEEWGGDTMYIDVSAQKGEGIDKLLDAIAVNAELLELRANPEKPAVGVVVEARLDRARGPIATVLIQEGTLRAGDIIVVGEHMGRVRALLDDRGGSVAAAGPSMPVEILGIDGVPDAGEVVNATEDEKKAKQVVEYRRQIKRKKELATTGAVSLESLMERIHEGESKELKVVVKADVHGSAEALKQALINLSTDKVAVNVIQAGVGGITETDVNFAKASGAIVVGFHVRPAGKAAKVAEKEGVEIKLYDIIYEALDEVKAAMAGLLAPVKREHGIGKAEVRETFTIPKVGVVAGSMVTEGKILRKSFLRVVRDAVQVYEGKVGSLRRFKEDTGEVAMGYECGIMVEGFNDVRVGDIIEAYEIIEEAATL
ncbi:MAG TPA: translation initiation factor IF-2 [Kofleriaceae bacterium]|nr:translation initiation factor IF-2 [Kofleriaceae bacterium]